jgi:hypothetical protein
VGGRGLGMGTPLRRMSSFVCGSCLIDYAGLFSSVMSAVQSRSLCMGCDVSLIEQSLCCLCFQQAAGQHHPAQKLA